MAALDASAVAALLVELGRRTALAGDNYFRAKAYQHAADRLAALVEPLDRVIAENRLRELPGIGETIADIVTKLHRTGTHPLLEKLRKDVPEGVLDMLSIPGLKPEKIPMRTANRLHPAEPTRQVDGAVSVLAAVYRAVFCSACGLPNSFLFFDRC